MRRYLLGAVITFAGGALARAQTPDQQEHCAMQAKQVLQEQVIRRDLKNDQLLLADYKSHYTKAGKCFALIMIKYQYSVDYSLKVREHNILFDAYEDRLYALYEETSPGPTPFVCFLPALGGTVGANVFQACNSRRDFDRVVARYFEQ
jgi:hypothetical protein